MGRLIDACKVIEKINCAIELLGIASKTAAENEGFQTTIKAYKDVRDAIMREPTAEPEKILCKECRYYIPHGKRCGFWNHGVNIDWFCSQGERRDDETD